MNLLSAEFWFQAHALGDLSYTPFSLTLGALLLCVLLVAQFVLGRFLRRRVFPRFNFEPGLAKVCAWGVGLAVLALGLLSLFPVAFAGLDTTRFIFREIKAGVLQFSPFTITMGILLLLSLFYFQGWMKRFLQQRVFPQMRLEVGVAHSLSTLAGYVILVLGLLAILPVAFPGFQFTTLSVVLGAISFGIGFGLRNIADNFVSGLIILFERPIKVGDRVEIGALAGSVVAIRARSTSVRTNDNIDIIVPNAQFISEQVVNWSHGDTRVRFRLPVGVHYNSDVTVVKRALEEAGRASPHVLAKPPPSAMFMDFGDSALVFELWVWNEDMSSSPRTFRSHMNYLIWDHLKKHGIEIPYPQRDIYIKEDPTHRLRGHEAEGGEPRQGSSL